MTNKKKPDAERRTLMKTIRVTQAECDVLRELAQKLGMFEAEVIRNLILFGRAEGEARPR